MVQNFEVHLRQSGGSHSAWTVKYSWVQPCCWRSPNTVEKRMRKFGTVCVCAPFVCVGCQFAIWFMLYQIHLFFSPTHSHCKWAFTFCSSQVVLMEVLGAVKSGWRAVEWSRWLFHRFGLTGLSVNINIITYHAHTPAQNLHTYIHLEFENNTAF